MDYEKRISELETQVSGLAQELRCKTSAALWWQIQLTSVIAERKPRLMAAWIRRRVALLKQWSPPDGSPDFTPAEADASLLELVPHIEAMGENIAADLDDAAQAYDAGEADPPPIFRA